MSVLGKLNVGIVGAAGRGGTFRDAFAAHGARIHAVCDVRADALAACAERLGASERYTDYDEMLAKSELDAVVIGTPMQFHADQSIRALERGLHVLCEVTAAVSIDECKALVAACARARGVYMMAENYTYLKPNCIVRELVRQGLFGTPYYAEGEYLHDVKWLIEQTPWRRTWQAGIDGITYGTHSLGPIMQWFPGDRVVRVACEGSGHHWKDPRGEPYCQDTCVMLAKTGNGALIKIRVDLLSDRPHAMHNYQLQGTDGAYESHREGPHDQDKIWLRRLSGEPRWHDLAALAGIDELADRFVPEPWRHPPPQSATAGHGGGDWFEVADFVAAITGAKPPPIGIHEAMDMCLPGLVSQESIRRGGAWLDVPDSRAWLRAPAPPQLRMLAPAALVAAPPAPTVPDAYELRPLRDGDEAAYMALMAKAGFSGWTLERVRQTRRSALPDGVVVAVESATGALVATALANHAPLEGLDASGELGWVAGDAAHAGKGLGRAVCLAVVARFARAGYRNVYLQTDDHRLPAIAVYVALGFVPAPYAPGMRERWDAVLAKLKR